ncbi:protein kinase [Gemmatirosa kalamazoonensis]|uniref:Protein kinase n=1 Tax=Gemmatirosa kalamazoonensis TaxID=861299 RepID=W0RER0_9BACT|nr:protein kinase [Gemmatirosa kalamazoonensis]AHG89266.1 protein kinase [Gemmatirosa kalamazoonensis]
MAVIDRERWRKLLPLLDQALELAGDERAAWLGELRARSPELAAELTTLLASEAAADRQGFLDRALETDLPNATRAGAELRAYLQAALGEAYTIERELGGGGMGHVFVARENALGRTVVVKVVLPLLAAGIRAERFAREVRVLAALQHPNVVPLFTAGEAGGLPYYVMPYVRGESLRARLTRDGRLPRVEALSVLRDVARALAFAHEQGVVHRDVKPENVLLAGDAAVVTDFGIAKAITSSAVIASPAPHEPTLSAVGSTIGTPAYMAPEQAAGDPSVDHRADLYAWGVLAYELLAGVHPFAHAASSHALLAAHLSETPAPLSRHAPDLSPTLAALVARCLEKDRARRPHSAREILDTFATVATPPDRSIAARWRGRRRLVPAALASAGLLALVGYAVAPRIHRPSAASPPPTPPATAPSLAVLPFEAVGGDTANAYFGDGIADEISTALSKVGGLRVASRTSAAAFRASHDVDVRELGRRLGVSTVIEGRVRRAGDRMRLTVQLTSVSDGLALWSDEYERRVTDVFQVQDDIARAIVAALRTRLPGIARLQSGRPVSAAGTTNADAYDLYLRGTYLLERRGGGVARAVEYFTRAIAEDSTFARAWAGLAYALELMPTFGPMPPRAVDPRATAAAHRALALDSTLAEAYTALALMHMHTFRWREADEAFRRAVAVDPGFAPAWFQYGYFLMRIGRVADAEEPYRRGRDVDPLSGTGSTNLAYCLSLLGRYDESLAESRRAYELDSSLAVVHSMLAVAVLHDGRPDEARALARAKLPMPSNGIAAYVLGATGDRPRAAAIVRELESRPSGEWLVARTLAFAYLGLGDTARVLSALEASVRVGELPALTLVDPAFDPVRRSARFAAVVRGYGLDERAFTSPIDRRPR